MKTNWRRKFLIGFAVFYALAKILQFLFFLGNLMQDILLSDDDDEECKECIKQYFEMAFISCLVIALVMLLYGVLKVNLKLCYVN
jgi:hypothetical protein